MNIYSSNSVKNWEYNRQHFNSSSLQVKFSLAMFRRTNPRPSEDLLCSILCISSTAYIDIINIYHLPFTLFLTKTTITMSPPGPSPVYKLIFTVPPSSLEACKSAIFAKGNQPPFPSSPRPIHSTTKTPPPPAKKKKKERKTFHKLPFTKR